MWQRETEGGGGGGSPRDGSLRLPFTLETDQNIEIEIFAEHEYTLNELPVKNIFSIRLIVFEI